MAKILYQGTHGTDDPTRASMPFHMALGAVEAGHTPEIGLAGDAVVCIKDNIIDSVKGFLIWESLSSKIFTVSMTGKACLAQDGHEIIWTPLDLMPNDFNIS